MQCSCRKKSLMLLAEIQRLTGDLIELENKHRNLTLHDVPDNTKNQIAAEVLESFTTNTKLRTSHNIQNWDDFDHGVESCLQFMKEEAAKLRGETT